MSSLPDLIEAPRAEQPSVTDVNGTVARFEMAYSPPSGETFRFGPPRSATLPAYLYLLCAALLGAVVVYGYEAASSTSRLYVWLVEGDRHRPLSAAGLAILVGLSALATVLRAHMRGVVVHGDGVEARYLLPLGIPRVKKWQWPQVHRVIVSDRSVALELWEGTYERLPDVADTQRMADLLVAIANGRRIQVTRLG